MVEFALIAPILFFLILATIEAGRFILHYELVNHATREGARMPCARLPIGVPERTPPPGEVNLRLAGRNIKAAVRDVRWTSRARFRPRPVLTGGTGQPQPGAASTGTTAAGVRELLVDYTYDPISSGLGRSAGDHHQRGIDACHQQLSGATKHFTLSLTRSRRRASPSTAAP
jgi:hypothetical protein